VIDVTCPFGFEKVLPAGLLREPLIEIRRADVIVITRCDQVDEVKLKQIEERVRSICESDILIAKSGHVPIFAKSVNETQIGIDELNDKRVFAFCGIGNPQAFFTTVASVCGGLTGTKIYDDHHKYTVDDIDRIYEQAQNSNAELILTTQKDFSKCNVDSSGRNIEFAYLAVELKISSGEDKLRSLIEEAIAGKISHK
jgi:tetraacyldisaccharide 4'-kinase